MRKLYQAADRIEAQLLRDQLESVGVSAVVMNDYLAGAAGELPANIYPEVWLLQDDDAVMAERVLLDFIQEHQERRGKGRWCCDKCGEWVDPEFNLCWNCSAPRTVAD
jgi:hypothetical protein